MQEQTENKAKILFVITKSNFGGAQRYVYELATRFKSEGYDAAVALGGDGLLKTKLEADGVPVFQIDAAQRDISITKEFKVLWRLFCIMRKFRPEIVHLNSPKIGGLGAVAARLCSVRKIVYTNHGWPFKEVRPEIQLILIRMFSWLTVFLGGTTIVLSESDYDAVKRWPLIGKKLVIVPNGLSPFTAKNKDEALERLIGKAKADRVAAEGWTVIGTISELHKNKGLDYALEGIRLYVEHIETDTHIKPAFIYVIMGEGERRAELEAQIREKGLEGHVVLAGKIDDAREYLTAFDIFLLASVKEGLPYAILEAGYAGVPVISTSVGGIPGVIKNLETGLLIPPARPTEIKNALIYIEEHPEIKATLAAALKKEVAETYDFDIVAKKIEAVYKA